MFKVNGNEYNLVDSWDELMLDSYIKFAKLEKDKEFLIPESHLLRLLEILSGCNEGDLDDLSLTQYTELQNSIEFLSEAPADRTEQHIVIDGMDYWFERGFNENISIGAYVSARTLIENAADELDVISKLIAILLRKATFVDGKWKQEKFDPSKIYSDAEVLEKRLRAVDIIGHLNFFLNGK